MQALLDADLDRAADALLEASRVLVGVAARSLPDNENVTLQQFRALVVLSQQDGVTATHVATALGIHQSSATRLCDRLVRKKLIKRLPGVADRREVTVSLSAAGRRLVERVSSRRRRELRAIAARMSPSSRAQALAGLTAFADATSEPTATVDRFGSAVP